MNKRYVIGLMSGTSLDGLDIAYCSFLKQESWSYKILSSKTVYYGDVLRSQLRNAPLLSDIGLKELSIDFGRFMAKELRCFMNEHSISRLDAVSSHGHTVFHQPKKGVTLQIGDPKPIYDVVETPIVYDFRSQDVVLGGQGAPLVPLVDKLLFPDYEACLNLGGFSNISFDTNGKRIAFDICPVNIVLNLLSAKLGFDYDDKGAIASAGQLDINLLNQLNNLSYYKQPFPKSLAWEWVVKNMLPLLENSGLSIEDQMRTFVEHTAMQMSSVAKGYNLKSILVSGGGVYNDFLVERLNYFAQNLWVKADEVLIESKEAMAFAFLALLRLENQVNILSSVTGSVKDHSSGRIYSEEL